MPISEFLPPRDGSVVCSDRGIDKGTCYLITEGNKGGFVSVKVFSGLGFNFDNSFYGDISFLQQAPIIERAQQAHRAGTLINNSGTLQIVGQHFLVGILAMSVLASWGYDSAKAVPANQFDKLMPQDKVLANRMPGIQLVKF